MTDWNTTRRVECVVCGSRFNDDCGDVFCSSSCEEKHEKYHQECERCGLEQGDDTFPDGKHCENCLDEMEEEK
jgi:hypothetical protein